jgi:hypothetical protein
LDGAIEYYLPAGEDRLDQAAEAEAIILEVHVA